MMLRTLALALVIAACGGGKKPADTTTTKPADETPTTTAKKEEPPPAEPVKAPEPAKPPPPKMLHAKARLEPVKGAKQKAAAITFTQEAGKPASVASAGWFDGLKPGKYHLVVHESKDCGPNATKAGKPFAPAASADLGFEAKKDSPGNIDSSGVDVKLEGDDAIVGHVLVLHDDAKGKPGKALACGAIAAVEDEDDAAKKE